LQRFDSLYAEEFETGIYPDEWHWSPHLDRSEVAGQMTGLWQKPLKAKETTLHQDSTYINSHTPVGETTTCWIALSNVFPSASSIGYVPGSHIWSKSNAVPEFHNKDTSYPSQMETAAAQAGEHNPKVVQMDLKPGSCVFHHGNIWHGSGQNTVDVTCRKIL